MKQRAISFLLDWITKKGFDVRAYQSRVEALGARHGMFSAILSTDDEAAGPDERLLELAEKVLPLCRTVRIPEPASRYGNNPAPFLNKWPGEHYRLLAAFCQLLGVKHAVEVGTFTGLGSLAMLPFLPPDGSLTTFDIVPWKEIPNCYLAPDDFADGRFRQEIADLSDPAICSRHAELLHRADLIFLDAAKDGVQEQRFLDNFEKVGLKPGALLVFDDIRVWNMLAIWRRVRRPKLDFTSFGHFTGTGLVHWA